MLLAWVIKVHRRLLKYQTTPLDSTGAAWGSGCKEHSTGWWQCCENMRFWAGQEYVQVGQLPEEGCCKWHV